MCNYVNLFQSKLKELNKEKSNAVKTKETELESIRAKVIHLRMTLASFGYPCYLKLHFHYTHFKFKNALILITAQQFSLLTSLLDNTLKFYCIFLGNYFHSILSSFY